MTAPAPLTEADVRRIFREELIRSLRPSANPVFPLPPFGNESKSGPDLVELESDDVGLVDVGSAGDVLSVGERAQVGSTDIVGEAHGSPSVGDSAAGTADVVEPIVGVAPGATSFGAPGASSGGGAP